MSERFTKSKFESDIELRMAYHVHGYWLQMIVVRRYKSLVNFQWEQADISWSSGGRDREQLECDIEAAANFAAALQDAIEQAKLMEQTP
jgi:hypothetical protein